jgi:2-haloacid dehalogenase/putative hydrolase of the HAD superfamily
MIRSIIFDCYGTFIDTGNGSMNAVTQILTKNRCGADPREFYSHWKSVHRRLCSSEPFRLESIHFLTGLKETYKAFSINGTPEDDVNIYLDTLGKRSIFPEVLAVVAELSTRFSLVIGSNSDHVPLVKDLLRNQIDIQPVYSSEILRSYKPDSNFFRKILSDIRRSTDEIIYVGDSQIEDILAPSRLGIKSIWVNRKNEKLHDDIPKPLLECSDLRGVLEVI